MSVIGQVESVWRYPVKSMRGETLPEVFAGFSGVYGDRLFAFKSSAAPAGFPYLTGREEHEMLLYRPRFRNPQKAASPPALPRRRQSRRFSIPSPLTRPTSPSMSRRRRASCWLSTIRRWRSSSPTGPVMGTR
jgi:hypothetical protein